MSLFSRRKPQPDPVLEAIGNLMSFSEQALEVSRDEARALTERIAQLEGLVASYAAELAAERGANAGTAERLAEVEQRLVSMGTELANQLHEMGREIDALASAPVDAGASALVEAVRESQARLAQEHARFAIAFRGDLAALADRVARRAGQ